MNLDLRLPMGLMFSIFGAMLSAYGLGSDRSIYEKSLGINVNLWWGLVLLAFGVAMLVLAARSRNRRDAGPRSAASPS
jgi:hypothetical protein